MLMYPEKVIKKFVKNLFLATLGSYRYLKKKERIQIRTVSKGHGSGTLKKWGITGSCRKEQSSTQTKTEP
jgi:ribosomal protein L3